MLRASIGQQGGVERKGGVRLAAVCGSRLYKKIPGTRII